MRLRVVLVVCAVTACGGSVSGLSKDASAVLTRDVQRVAVAAHGTDPSAFDVAVQVLKDDVAAERDAGSLSAAKAAQILAALGSVVADSPQPVAATPTPDATSDGHGKGKGDGNGGGDGGDNGNGG